MISPLKPFNLNRIPEVILPPVQRLMVINNATGFLGNATESERSKKVPKGLTGNKLFNSKYTDFVEQRQSDWLTALSDVGTITQAPTEPINSKLADVLLDSVRVDRSLLENTETNDTPEQLIDKPDDIAIDLPVETAKEKMIREARAAVAAASLKQGEAYAKFKATAVLN